MSKHLQISLGSMRILDERVRAIGQPGLTLWTEAGEQALQAHRAELAEVALAAAQAKEMLERVSARTSKAQIFAAIEEANRALAGALERLTLGGLLVVLLCLSLGNPGDDDDLARRAPRGRSGRRRDDVVALADGETGEAFA